MSGRRRETDGRLGMDRPIHRRDFLNGIAVAVGALGAGLAGCGPEVQAGWPQDRLGYYPPLLNGLRGSHPGAFENAHHLRDGDFWSAHSGIEDTGDTYDLVVVGGGISGLSAAWFYRAARPDARVLILDNHDDFGGHAKRNEFQLDGKLHLLNGGTQDIDSPNPYSPVAAGLLKTLGIDPVALTRKCDREALYEQMGLGDGLFFGRETFGQDRLVARIPGNTPADAPAWQALLASAPLSEVVRADVVRLETGETDYMPGLTSEAKKDRLSRMSYRDFLLNVAHADPGVIPFYQNVTHDEWGVGIDAVSALDAWGYGVASGMQGLKLAEGSAPRMGPTASGYADGGSDTFHFPDGNASVARLLVRKLVPAAIPGSTAEDVVAAPTNYSELDWPTNPVRIRLSSIAVRVRNQGGPAASQGVEVAYVRGDQVYSVKARDCVMASWNMMIPYIMPELPQAQKTALHELVKTPLVYVSAALTNWRAFHKLGVKEVRMPGGYYTFFRLNQPVDIGGCTAERSPDRPMLVHMVRTPNQPGLPEHDQNRAGRAEILATSFATFEHHVRDQLGRALGPGGFDPASDITAITVNRWPHGYTPEWNPLWQPELPPEQRPNVIGRARFGRVAIANADSGGRAYTDSAIDQAHRAVTELLAI